MTAAQHVNSKYHQRPNDADQLPRPMQSVIEEALTRNHHAFYRFLVRRLGDESAAEDVLQAFCLRVITSGSNLRNGGSVIAWLYSVLRSVLTDHYRSETARRRRDADYAREQTLLGNDRDEIELQEQLCNCFYGLLSKLRPDYAEIVRRVDFLGEPRENVIADLGITSANVRVRLHRGRQALRKAVVERCGSCCEQSFRNCTCGDQHSHGTKCGTD